MPTSDGSLGLFLEGAMKLVCFRSSEVAMFPRSLRIESEGRGGEGLEASSCDGARETMVGVV